ncbi:hypothetical protein [Streptomyces sp. TLI_171]|uniref:hypothetical protein n=1 Tax=Streptomyces sp. TLI_171 TaxID=1938859 RepID=UPI00117ED960|nr:hypothetical protein [Streptomyces sp. TLI_171]
MPLVAAVSMLVVCAGGFVGFVLVIAQGMSDPAPGATSDPSVYWPALLLGATLSLLSLGAVIGFLVLRHRGRRRLGQAGLVFLAFLYALGLLAGQFTR